MKGTAQLPAAAKKGPGRPPKVREGNLPNGTTSTKSHAQSASKAATTISEKHPSSFGRARRRANTLISLQNGHTATPNSRTRRSARTSEMQTALTPEPENQDPFTNETRVTSPRIRLKVKQAQRPRLHPDHVLRRPRQYDTLDEYFKNAGFKPLDEGGLFSADDDFIFTDSMALKEARTILRMEEAAAPGGILSGGVSSVYMDESEREFRMPKQYSHQDHLVRAAANFRLLMLDEHKRHKRNAKRLAEACRDEWCRKQPKSEEELEAEARIAAELQYKSLVKTLQATWENVSAEVNRRRQQEYDAAEQVKLNQKLKATMDLADQKLKERRGSRQGSEAMLSDEDDLQENLEGSEDEEDSLGGSEDGDSNMSSSESEADPDHETGDGDKGGDEHLTVDELKAKYSNLPETPKAQSEYEVVVSADVDDESKLAEIVHIESDMADDSDESIDMDDDMGSSDEGQDSDEEDDEGDDEDDDDAGDASLLGFLGVSDLAELGVKPKTHSIANSDGEDMLDDEDEVSLIPDASQPPAATQTAIENASPEGPNSDSANQGDEHSESLVPSQVTTTKDEGGEPNGERRASTTPHPLSEVITMDVDDIPMEREDVKMADAGSPNRSNQHSPRTSVTKPPEIDSVSSVELQQQGKTVFPADTQLPDTQLQVQPPSSKAKTPIPFLLRGTLREYQHDGLDWLAGLYATNTNGILADEMGLGKTIQTIALLAHLACEHHVWGPHLVIVPTSVMLNWEMEFKKWCPGFKILAYYGTQDERRKKRQGWTDDDTWNVCITSYQLVIQDAQVFKRRRWHYMILDEAHNIKNFRSQRWQTLLGFNTRARLLLTGTPLQNNLTELWSLLFFLMPSDGEAEGMGGFAELHEFSDWFKKPQEQILENGRETMDDESRAIILKLHNILRPYLLRRMKADVEKQMPAKYEHVEYCRLSRRQRELYDGFLSRSGTRETLASGNYLSIINCLMQLRKVCNHPDLFLERPIASSFPMQKSAIADFEVTDLIIRKRLLHQDLMSTVSLDFLNLIPTRKEQLSLAVNERSNMLTAQRVLMDMREAQRIRAQNAMTQMDLSTVRSNLTFLEGASRWSRFEELQHIVYLNALRRQSKPIYGKGLVEYLDVGATSKIFTRRPTKRERVLEWICESSSVLKDMVVNLNQRAEEMDPYLRKFACITPPIVAPDALPIVLSRRGVEYFQTSPNRDVPDPFHEARMRLSIQFPDKRLLQYDCGKLQALDKLLRRLVAGGHRALIFTQMTKVLDILEQFLNIHGHRYLRLDGATKIEQRQILTDRFNNDTRIPVFILSSRSGGLGINLTGADTVIFYDLDWNPAMDKQCQDRAHRIGQTREVHIYRLVSEHTIEANILRKANQKRMLDDVVIQEGEFTTDYFNKKTDDRIAKGDVDDELLDGDEAASAAMDRVLGGGSNTTNVQRVLEQAEDKEDVVAAKLAQQEIQADDQDFAENAASTATTPKPSAAATPMEDSATPLDAATPAPDIMVNGELIEEVEDELSAEGMPIKSIDDYMVTYLYEELKDIPVDPPKDKRNRKGRDHRRDRNRKR